MGYFNGCLKARGGLGVRKKKNEAHMAFNTFWENWFRRTSIGTFGSSVLMARNRHSLQVGVLRMGAEATFRRISGFFILGIQ